MPIKVRLFDRRHVPEARPTQPKCSAEHRSPAPHSSPVNPLQRLLKMTRGLLIENSQVVSSIAAVVALIHQVLN